MSVNPTLGRLRWGVAKSSRPARLNTEFLVQDSLGYGVKPCPKGKKKESSKLLLVEKHPLWVLISESQLSHPLLSRPNIRKETKQIPGQSCVSTGTVAFSIHTHHTLSYWRKPSLWGEYIDLITCPWYTHMQLGCWTACIFHSEKKMKSGICEPQGASTGLGLCCFPGLVHVWRSEDNCVEAALFF